MASDFLKSKSSEFFLCALRRRGLLPSDFEINKTLKAAFYSRKRFEGLVGQLPGSFSRGRSKGLTPKNK
jgi:hypothetical protein